MTKKTIDPLFAAFAKSAPALDLAFYLNYARRHAHEYSTRTVGIVADMAVMLAQLQGGSFKGSTAAQKRAVWAIISEFRGSIPQWWKSAVCESVETEVEAA